METTRKVDTLFISNNSEKSYRSQLNSLLALMFASVFWCLIVPAIVAYIDGVLYEEKVVTRLPKDNPQVKDYFKWKTQRSEAEHRLEEISMAIRAELQETPNPQRLSSLLVAQEQFAKIAAKRSPIRVVGFFEAQSPYYFLVSLFALLLHAHWTPICGQRSQSWRTVLPLALAAYALWSSPNWARNFLFVKVGRTVFSNVHIDISVFCFLFQEIQVFFMCLLLAWSWVSWVRLADSTLKETSQWIDDTLLPQVIHTRARDVGRTLDLWQFHSVLLACVFLPWALFYWQISLMYGDVRYYSSALACHCLWGISWWVVSNPSIAAWTAWNCYRTRLLSVVITQCGNDEPLTKYITESSPITDYRIVFIGTASIIAFMLPFLNFLR